MWQFLCGFGVGVYAGTFYDCRPCIKTINNFIKDNIPEKKPKEDEKKKE